jgi:tryptophanyl-tRNA synthetase
MGYGDAKQRLYDAAMIYFADARSRRERLVADKSLVEDVLQAGARKARTKGREVLDRSRKACGLGTSLL